MGSKIGFIIIEEVDGAPTAAVYKLKVTNDMLTDNGDGSATIDLGGALGSKTIKAMFFATISSGTTSGTITKPAGTNATLIMDEWGTSTDAILSTMENGKPTFVSPRDSSGAVITTTFNTSGDYAFSATPSPAADHALVFVYTAGLGDFLVAETLGESELVPEDSTMIIPTTDHTAGDGSAKISHAVGETVVFGQIGIFSGADLEYMLADADASTSLLECVMFIEGKGNGEVCEMVTKGFVMDESWSLTPGEPIYASTTAGAITQTPPSTGVQEYLGYAVRTNIIYFKPSPITYRTN